MLISLYSPKGTYNGLFLGNYALINVNDALYRVPGVGQVNNFGASEYAMRIWVRPDQLASLGLTVADLLKARPAAEHGQPRGADRRRAGAAGAGVHLRRARPGAARRPPRSSATSWCA